MSAKKISVCIRNLSIYLNGECLEFLLICADFLVLEFLQTCAKKLHISIRKMVNFWSSCVYMRRF